LETKIVDILLWGCGCDFGFTSLPMEGDESI
jgi:hypothetical protein